MALTKEQIEARRKSIGSSDSAAICGLNPWMTAYDVWASKTGRVDDWTGNEATEAGDRLEEAIVMWAVSKIAPTNYQVKPLQLRKGIMSANLDADAICDGAQVVIEAKTSGITGPLDFDQWGEEGTADVPEHYTVQVQHQLAVTGYDLAYLAALIPPRGFVLYTIPRNQEVIDALQETVERFWKKHVLADVPPEGVPSMEVAKRIRRVGGMSKQIDASTVLAWQRARDERQAAEKAEEAAKLAVIAALGQGDCGISEAGTVTFYEQSRKAYEVKAATFRTLLFRGNQIAMRKGM